MSSYAHTLKTIYPCLLLEELLGSCQKASLWRIFLQHILIANSEMILFQIIAMTYLL